MNTIGSPVFVPPQLNNSIAAAPGQQTTASTENTSRQSYPADTAAAQNADDANDNGERSSEGSDRVKRGVFQWPRIPARFRSGSSGLPPPVTAGVYTPKVGLPPKTSAGPHNSPGMTNFRSMVFKAYNPNSAPLSGPAKSIAPKPKTFGEVAGNLIAADRMVKAGVFKTDTPLKVVARDAFISASINGLVSTPFSVGTYAGSVWTGETIKGNFTANTPLLPPAHQPAPSQQVNAGSAAVSAEQSQNTAVSGGQLDNAELKLLLVANTIQTLIEGEEAKALGKSPDWPVGTKERLSNLEKLYDAAEKNLAAFATKNEFIFNPYVPDSASGTKTDVERLFDLEKRNEKVNAGIGRLLAVRSLETGE